MATDVPGASGSPAQHDVGWHPDRINPNLQRYWDGTGWTQQRRWVARQWMIEPLPGMPAGVAPGMAPPMASPPGPTGSGDPAPAGAAPPPPPPGQGPAQAPSQRYPAPPAAASGAQYAYQQPYAASSARRAAARPVALTGTLVSLLVSSIVVIIGSFTPWLTVSVGPISQSANGSDSVTSTLIGLQGGWLTFAGGLIMLIFVVLIAVSGESNIATATLIVAVVTAGFAIYDLVRTAQKISEASNVSSLGNGPLRPDISVGWGLIVCVIGALAAVVFAFLETRRP